MASNPSSWVSRALGAAITLVVVALLLRWAWLLLQPLALPAAVVVVVFLILRFLLGRYQRF